ncbi:hypothetical protein BDR06DRAFT_458868 [Suillus hirtellus]|nr:hypothetical protein BDR06DRAFT_458868 [Suillus hirtellus]
MGSFRDKETHLGSTYYQLQECSFFIHLLNLLIRSLGALSRHVVVAATAGPRACILFLVCGATFFLRRVPVTSNRFLGFARQ